MAKTYLGSNADVRQEERYMGPVGSPLAAPTHVSVLVYTDEHGTSHDVKFDEGNRAYVETEDPPAVQETDSPEGPAVGTAVAEPETEGVAPDVAESQPGYVTPDTAADGSAEDPVPVLNESPGEPPEEPTPPAPDEGAGGGGLEDMGLSIDDLRAARPETAQAKGRKPKAEGDADVEQPTGQ